MTTLRDLLPGDLVTKGSLRMMFIQSCPHPVREGLLLVIWRWGDGSIRLGTLRPDDKVGDVEPIEPAARAARLADALAGRLPAAER